MSQSFIYDTELCLTAEGAENGTRAIPENTVLVVVRGMSLAKEFRIAITRRPMTFNQDVKALQCAEDIDPQFLFYALKARKEYIRDLATEASHGTKKLETSTLNAVEIMVPETIKDQRAVAAVALAYDDLIENNRRRIALLECAARQLYKEWFVRFRFPGHEHVKIIDGVPEGWEILTYGETFDFLGGFAFKSSTYIEDGKYGIVTIKNVHDGHFVTQCGSRVPDIPQKMNAHCNLQAGDILLSLTGNVGRACVVIGENLLLNQRVAKVIGKQNIPCSFTYWTFSNPETQRELENLAYGVAQLNLSPVKLAARPFVRPPNIILEGFAAFAEPVLAQIIKLNQGLVELAKARDFLLPKLMSGAIAV